MSEERKHGYPPRYVLLKGMALPDDLTYVSAVKEAQNLPSRNHALRLILKEAREAMRFLNLPDPQT